MKSIKEIFSCFKFRVCASFPYTQNWNKLGKVWFHSTLLVKFHGYSVRNFQFLKQLFLN